MLGGKSSDCLGYHFEEADASSSLVDLAQGEGSKLAVSVAGLLAQESKEELDVCKIFKITI